MGILTLAGGSVWMERTNTSQSVWARMCVLTKRWNEDDPARWPQSVRAR